MISNFPGGTMIAALINGIGDRLMRSQCNDDLLVAYIVVTGYGAPWGCA